VGEIKIFALAANEDERHAKNINKTERYLNKVVALKSRKLV
tara:strand:- start:562 stop:684 length:123 start_codon:yes stop_codon:yes gene_type:complete